MGFEFVIPHCKDDLLNKSGINHYVVDEVLPLRVLPGQLQEYKLKLRTQGSAAILSHFDTFFSILVNMNTIAADTKELALDLILKTLSGLATHLATALDKNGEQGSRLEQLNILKMSTYLMSQLVEALETESTYPSANQLAAGGKGRKGRKPNGAVTSSAAMGFNWESEKEKAMHDLGHLMQLPLQRLWEPPVADQEFVNMVTTCCYKLLENPATTRSKSCRDAIFYLLGTAAKRYNHALGASLKVVQLLQTFDHLGSPLAQLVAQMSVQFGAKGVVGDVMREVGRMDARDLSMDSSGTRSLCGFLVELAQLVPEQTLPTMSVLVPFLDEEQSYPMRNAVLGMMGEILVRALTKDNLEAKLKTSRDLILDRLEDHIHDVHAFVRSRVLQIWHNIINEKALPLPRQQHVVDLFIGRLHDKSSQVRKYAVQVMTALIKTNPYAPNLSVEVLANRLEEEKAKLATMLPANEDSTGETAISSNIDAAIGFDWLMAEADFRSAIKRVLATGGDSCKGEGASTIVISDDDTVASVTERIRACAQSGLYDEAVRLLAAGHEAFPGTALSVPALSDSIDREIGDDSSHDGETSDNGGMQDKVSGFLQALRDLLVLESGALHRADDAATGDATEAVVTEVSKQQVLVRYLKECLTFVKQIQTAMPVVAQLLGSKSNTDIMEAIEFFVAGCEFHVANAVMGVTKMLALVWSREQSVKEAVVEAYRRLYINGSCGGSSAGENGHGGPSGAARPAQIVANLAALVHTATAGDITSLEVLVAELVRRGDVSSALVQALWQRFTMKAAGTTAEDSRAALVLIGMAASADPDIVNSNVDVLVAEGLGDRAINDFWLARDTCIVLLKLAGNAKPKAGQYAKQMRFPEDHPMFSRLVDLLVTGFSDMEQRGWVPLSEQAVNVIYRLSESPDMACSQLIKRLATAIASTNCRNAGTLTRLVTIVGHAALRQLVHLDIAIFGELKRRAAVVEKQPAKDKRAANSCRPSIAASRSAAPTPARKDNSDTVEDELGLTGASAEDAESEYIRKVTEQEVVTGSNLLAVMTPLLVAICSNPTKYPDSELQAAATLALSKFMLVSSEFCDAHLQLLFTILERSANVIIRANAIVALGDLTFRFPNLIEPWTSHLYARLRDPSACVRKSTTMVLSHLILNDMVKVKGQISEMAMCTVDEDERIAGLAKLFFSELSKKGNSVYNIMPDVISRLSDEESGTTEDDFRLIMRFLFSFIEKERQCETLIEKLCLRFRATRSERQWHDLAFCLSLLSYSEKGIRKLQEHFACFADKLGVEEVHGCFASIIAAARKTIKADSKAVIDEFEQRIEECHKKGADDDAAAKKADRAKTAAQRRLAAANAAGGQTCSKGKKVSALTQQNSNTEQESPATNSQATERARRVGGKSAVKKPAKSRKQPVLAFSSSEEEDFDVAVAKKAVAQKQRIQQVPTFSSDDDEDEEGGGRWTAEESADCSRIEADLSECSESENVNPGALLKGNSKVKAAKSTITVKNEKGIRSGKAPVDSSVRRKKK